MSDMHTVWCDHRGTDDLHDDFMPYCYKLLHGVQITPEPGYSREQMWVSPTRTAHPDALSTGEKFIGSPYDGIELAIEKRSEDGDSTDEQHLWMSADAARSLAATLIRAADIEQGLTR